MWVRGLKPHKTIIQNACAMSHPMWVRGLKQFDMKSMGTLAVAPYVGAWIET